MSPGAEYDSFLDQAVKIVGAAFTALFGWVWLSHSRANSMKERMDRAEDRLRRHSEQFDEFRSKVDSIHETVILTEQHVRHLPPADLLLRVANLEKWKDDTR